MNRRAERINQKGIDLEDRGWPDEAEKAYLKAAKIAPDWSAPLFNLGLLFKRARRWRESLDFNLRATKVDSSDEGAWWNLGIAATALSDWDTARYAWQGYGLDLPHGKGPIELNMGLTPIRISPESKPEVVWCRRISPAQARIESVPFPESERRHWDLVLHDGAPNGYRNLNGKQVPVFDEIELQQSSSFSTYFMTAKVSGPDSLKSLIDLAEDKGLVVEDWTGNIEVLCEKCSTGVPHKHHLRVADEWKSERNIGIAAKSPEQVQMLLDQWVRDCSDCSVDSAELVLEPVGD